MTNPEQKDLPFQDISQEKVRTYRFPDGSQISIEDPVALYVSDSGGHRILSGTEEKGYESHYVRPSWRMLSWQVEKGSRPFIGFGETAQENTGIQI